MMKTHNFQKILFLSSIFFFWGLASLVLVPANLALAQDMTFGTETEFDANMTGLTTIGKLVTNKFVFCYADGDATSKGRCKIGEVTGATTLTFGPTSTFISQDISSPAGDNDVCRLDTDKFVMVYPNESLGNDGYAVAGSVTGLTITAYGPTIEFANTDTEYISCAQTDTDEFVICYNDETDSDRGKCMAGQANGLTLTFGPEGRMHASQDIYPKWNGAGKLSDGKFVNCFNAFDFSEDGYCVVGRLSGLTIAFGNAALFTSSGARFHDICEMGTDKFVNVFRLGGNKIWAVQGQVSGLTIEYDGPAAGALSSNSLCANPGCAPIDDDDFIATYYDPADNKGYGVMGTVDWGNTISAGTEVEFNDGATGGGTDGGIDTATVARNRFVIIYQDDAQAGDPGYGIVGNGKSLGPLPGGIMTVP